MVSNNFFQKLRKIAQRLGAPPPDPYSLRRLGTQPSDPRQIQHVSQFRYFRILTIGLSPPPRERVPSYVPTPDQGF